LQKKLEINKGTMFVLIICKADYGFQPCTEPSGDLSCAPECKPPLTLGPHHHFMILRSADDDAMNTLKLVDDASHPDLCQNRWPDQWLHVGDMIVPALTVWKELPHPGPNRDLECPRSGP